MTRYFLGIPARMGSTRLPGKPLVPILGIPMLERILRNTILATKVHEVFVAGCDEPVQTLVESKGFRYVHTDSKIDRPCVRVASAATQLAVKPDDIVIVLQGDEPMISGPDIDAAVSLCECLDYEEILNLMYPVNSVEAQDVNEVKVVTNEQKQALYFSRAPIPHLNTHESYIGEGKMMYLKQVCLYGFRAKSLSDFSFNLPASYLERSESIEINRALSHGWKTQMLINLHYTKSVDTAHDLKIVEALLADVSHTA